MSMPKYLRESTNKAPSSVVVAGETFTNYIFKITANEKQFPKSLRYSLIKKLQTRCVTMMEHIYDGCNKKPVTKKDFKRTVKCQNQVYDDLAKLKALISVANSNANLTNYEHLADLYVNLLDAYRKWVRNVGRARGRAKRNGMYTKKDRKKTFNRNRLTKLAREMDHDSDGFAVLRRKAE